eukprot:scaffold30276_cov39-Phaeocystis_antarctica.AAC.1
MLPITTCPPWPDVLGGLPWRDVGRLAAPTASNLLCGNQDPALRPHGRPSDLRPARAPESRATWPARAPEPGHVAGQRNREPGLYLPGEPGYSCAAPVATVARLSVEPRRAGPQLRRTKVPAYSAPFCGREGLAWCGATLWATLWATLCYGVGPTPCVLFDLGNLSTMGNALMLPPLPAAELCADTYIPEPTYCTYVPEPPHCIYVQATRAGLQRDLRHRAAGAHHGTSLGVPYVPRTWHHRRSCG